MIEYPSGLDVEWMAVDRKARMGVFTTAGTGPIPKVYLTTAGPLDQIWDAIRSLPEFTQHILLVTLTRPDDFIAFARRGLFSFDWADVHRARRDETGRYEIQARPETPLKADAISWREELRVLLEQVTSSALDFDEPSIDVMSALECAAEPAVADGRGPRLRSEPGR